MLIEQVFLIIGSNQGNRLQLIQDAHKHISNRLGTVVKSSFIYETEPWGNNTLECYLNQVFCITTKLTPEELMTEILLIEKQMGRVRKHKWESRVIDIDILFYNNLIINRPPQLIIPHPYIQERNFVLTPLCEIAPKFVHPTLLKSIYELLNKCTDRLKVKKYLT